MPPLRPLPPDLRARLQHARRLEQLVAGEQERHRRAIAATGVLMIACLDAGWRQIEINTALRLTRGAMQKRVKFARQRHADHRPALVVDPPARPAMPVTHRRYLADTALGAREWLTRNEVAQMLGVDPKTVTRWRQAGRLPSARTDQQPHLYSRAELVNTQRG